MNLGTEEQLVYKNGQSQQHVGYNRSLASPITGLELRSWAPYPNKGLG